MCRPLCSSHAWIVSRAKSENDAQHIKLDARDGAPSECWVTEALLPRPTPCRTLAGSVRRSWGTAGR